MIKQKTVHSTDTKPSISANHCDSFLIEDAEEDFIFLIKIYIIKIKEAEDVRLLEWPNGSQTCKYFQTKCLLRKGKSLL